MAPAWATLAAWTAEDARASAVERAASTPARACSRRVRMFKKIARSGRGAVMEHTHGRVFHRQHRADMGSQVGEGKEMERVVR
jgi:hypothetical protein